MNDLAAPVPQEAQGIQKRNFRYVQIDAIGIGLANAASSFLPVYLTLLGASNEQVGLLTSIPGVTGLALALLVGRFLQTRRKIVPWFSLARLLVVSAYGLTGVVSLLLPRQYAVIGILAIWAAASLPQTMLNVAFSVVMNAVAGPEGRYTLMSRRWSILGVTSAAMAFLAGQVLDRISFPLNYQLVFLILSLGGLLSYYFSSRITLPDSKPPLASQWSLAATLRQYAHLVREHPAFVSFVGKRFVFLSGMSLAAPLFPLYLVREVQASNAWIGSIATAQTVTLVIGYFSWTWLSRRRGSRFVLLVTTLAIGLYPALVAATRHVELIVALAALSGVFQAGIDLVFFDELMKTVPAEYSATFVSIAQMLQYLSAIVSPMVGTFLAGYIGLGGALLVSAGLRLAGFALFAGGRQARPVGGEG